MTACVTSRIRELLLQTLVAVQLAFAWSSCISSSALCCDTFYFCWALKNRQLFWAANTVRFCNDNKHNSGSCRRADMRLWRCRIVLVCAICCKIVLFCAIFCRIVPFCATRCKIVLFCAICCRMCHMLQDSSILCHMLQDSSVLCHMLQDSSVPYVTG